MVEQEGHGILLTMSWGRRETAAMELHGTAMGFSWRLMVPDGTPLHFIQGSPVFMRTTVVP